MKENSYQFLLKKLNEFIRKYYINQIIRGLILFFSLAFVLFLTVITLEYIGQFSSTVRTALFYGFTSLLLIVFSFLIIAPALKILSIGKKISHEQASRIIGSHFQEVNDKLFNILQLNALHSKESSDLVAASINQKISELRPVPFAMAVNLKENTKYLKYLIVPFLIIIGLAAFEPKIIVDSTNRLVDHQKDFVPSAPYEINIENKTLTAYKNESFHLKITLEGEEIPSNLNIIFEGQRFLMQKKGKTSFEYSFKNIQKSINFHFFDGEFKSQEYAITTLPKPLLSSFSTFLNYPDYLQKKDVTINNNGDLVVPEGTQIKWTFFTESTDGITFISGDSTSQLVQQAQDEFIYKNRFFKSQSYGISMANRYLKNEDTIYYSLEVIPDLSPSIEVDTKSDSLNPSMLYFKGIIKDDYGFSRLLFHYQFIGANDSLGLPHQEVIPINKNVPQAGYFHALNTDLFKLNAGDRIEYYFEVWDNDGVNGSKPARTQFASFKAPTKDELSQKNKENNQLVKKELEESIQLTQEIKKDLEELNEKLLNKKELGFQEKKKLKSLLEKQKKIQQSLDRMKDKNKQNNQLQERFSPQEQALVEKQQQLQEMFEKVMSEEMKEMMKEIEKMMEKLQKDKLQESLEKIELSNEEMEKELDRNLELFKQLELEKEITEAKEKLDELKEKQADLKEQSQEKKKDAQEIKKEQDKLNEEFDELSEKLDDIQKKNEELEEPKDLEETKSLEEEIKEDMKESSEQLQKNNKKNASESQQSSESKMEELSEKMQSMQMQMQSQANAENLEDMRALLENLIQLSFDQEDVMQLLKKTDRNDPQYVPLVQQQKKLKDDSKIIEDSLFALSKRVQQLSNDINREMTAVNFNMKKAIDDLGERRTQEANSRQQLSMTSLNNLALLLDAAVQSMQQQMQQQAGKGSCSKPGGKGKPSPGSMKKMQEQLNKQMEGLKKALEEGKKPGGKKGSKPGSKGFGGMSKELAQMAAKQAAIRKSLEQMQEQLGNEGSDGSGGSLKKLGELMEQTETDLVNKRITNQTILRQQEILTRLLQSEKAEREREKDEKRESTEFLDEISRNQNNFLEYNRLKEQEIELLKTLPPSFNSFYKSKVSEYFNRLEK